MTKTFEISIQSIERIVRVGKFCSIMMIVCAALSLATKVALVVLG